MNFYGGETVSEFHGNKDGHKSCQRATPFSLRNWIVVVSRRSRDSYLRRRSALTISKPNDPFSGNLLVLASTYHVLLPRPDGVFVRTIIYLRVTGVNIEQPQQTPTARLATKSRNNKSESGVTLFMGLLYGDDVLRGLPNMSQSVAVLSAIVVNEGGSAQDHDS